MFTEEIAELLTVRDFLRLAVSRFSEAKLFFGHGVNNAFDEAAYLILHTLKLPIDQPVDVWLDARLLKNERQAILEIIEKRIEKRVPAAYLTQEAYLGDYRFYVDERVIVPRSYCAELLLSDAFSPWIKSPEKVHRALDLCTGSGCLAIVLAQVFPHAFIDAVDISQDALNVAAINVNNYALEDRISLIQSDGFAAISEQNYDFILSNPPYVNAQSMKTLPPEYLHEPTLALASGEDGLDFTRHIFKHAAAHLSARGILAVEIGHNRAALEEAFPKTPFMWLAAQNHAEAVFLLEKKDIPLVK